MLYAVMRTEGIERDEAMGLAIMYRAIIEVEKMDESKSGTTRRGGLVPVPRA
jgi:hypothetical protein